MYFTLQIYYTTENKLCQQKNLKYKEKILEIKNSHTL